LFKDRVQSKIRLGSIIRFLKKTAAVAKNCYLLLQCQYAGQIFNAKISNIINSSKMWLYETYGNNTKSKYCSSVG
jgi:hypothetical protein